MLLNFGGRKRSGAFDTVWPSATNFSAKIKRKHTEQHGATCKRHLVGRNLPHFSKVAKVTKHIAHQWNCTSHAGQRFQARTNGQEHILSGKLPELASFQDVNRAVWLAGSLFHQAPKWLEKEKRSLKLLSGSIIPSKKKEWRPRPSRGGNSDPTCVPRVHGPQFAWMLQFPLLPEQFQRTFCFVLTVGTHIDPTSSRTQ